MGECVNLLAAQRGEARAKPQHFDGPGRYRLGPSCFRNTAKHSTEAPVRALFSLMILGAAAVASTATSVAWAEPLPQSGPLALDAFFDGCLNPVLNRKDPGPAIEQALAAYKHETSMTPDAQHPEHKLWHVRGEDGDVEVETFNGKAWCEVRLSGSDPDTMALRLNNALLKIDIPMQRRSLPSDAPGVSAEAAMLGHDAGDATIVWMREAREPKDGEPGLTLSAAPIRPEGQNGGQNAGQSGGQSPTDQPR